MSEGRLLVGFQAAAKFEASGALVDEPASDAAAGAVVVAVGRGADRHR